MAYCRIQLEGEIINEPRVRTATKTGTKWTFLKVKTDMMYVKIKIFGDDADRLCGQCKRGDTIEAEGEMRIEKYNDSVDILCDPERIKITPNETKALKIIKEENNEKIQ